MAPVPDKRIFKASAINVMLPWGSYPHPYQQDTNYTWIGQRDRWFSLHAFTGVTVGGAAIDVTTSALLQSGLVLGYKVSDSPFILAATIDTGDKLSNTVPSATWDVNSGYNVGSLIIYNNSDIYMCADNTAGAAVWRKLN